MSEIGETRMFLREKSHGNRRFAKLQVRKRVKSINFAWTIEIWIEIIENFKGRQ